MAALYLFGPRTTITTRSGAPGGFCKPAHPDYVAVKLQSGRNTIELHLAANTASALAEGLQRAADALRSTEDG